jgi:hypothetical protein
MGIEQTEQKQRDEGDERGPGTGDGGAGGGERNQVLPMDEVPGVRGPMSSSGEREMPPEGDLESWGSEGGAGTYQGAPNISEARVPPSGSRRTPR